MILNWAKESTFINYPLESSNSIIKINVYVSILVRIVRYSCKPFAGLYLV